MYPRAAKRKNRGFRFLSLKNFGNQGKQTTNGISPSIKKLHLRNQDSLSFRIFFPFPLLYRNNLFPPESNDCSVAFCSSCFSSLWSKSQKNSKQGGIQAKY